MKPIKSLIEGLDYRRIDPKHNDGMKFVTLKTIRYFSLRYRKYITAVNGYRWDGASGARDLEGSKSHLFHDVLCEFAVWDDGSSVSNWQASRVLSDILKEECYRWRKYTWFAATFLFGGWKIKRENSWF